VAKATDVIGVRLRAVAVDRDRRLDLAALAEAIGQDREQGHRPFCVIASAGTTATGAVDRLGAIARLAREHDLWFHVDGAYGALAASQPSQKHLFEGIEQADSLSIDPHKWLYVPIDCGALLLRRPSAGAFGSAGADYVRILAEEELEKFAFWDHGIELSRRFRALKVWMTIRYYGARRLAGAIANDIAMASHMADLVRAADDLELMCEPSLSICCFRHAPPGADQAQLDGHNERLLAELQRSGFAYLSNASIEGRFALRACITNFRTTTEDVRRAVDLVRKIGAGLPVGLNQAGAGNPA